MMTSIRTRFAAVLEAFIILLIAILPILPVVDLVDQQRGQGANGDKTTGTMVATLNMGDGEGPFGNHSKSERSDDTRSRGMGTTRMVFSGNWNSISHRQQHQQLASSSSSLQLRSVSFPNVFEMFPGLTSSSSSSSSSSAEESVTVEQEEFEEEHGRELDKAKLQQRSKQQRHHQHPQHHAKSTINGAGEYSFHKGRNMLLSRHHASMAEGGGMKKKLAFLVEPPEPLASSTRVTGPYFDANQTTIHISAKAGQNVVFDCTVILLQGRTVSWLRRGNDSLQLLTVGNITYYNDPRLGLRFRYPNNWRLGIDSVEKTDEGEYQCQLSTHPVKTLIYQLKVIAPDVVILDDNGHSVSERHYKVDSSLHLTCRASHVDKFVEKVVWLKGNRALSATDSRIKLKVTKNDEVGEMSIQLSILSLRTVDSGNYSCVAGSLARYTVTVHVVNGELPAAVQHESGATSILLISPLVSCFNLMLFNALTTIIIYHPISLLER